jgi:glutathione synthase/RimK-type ligase-like ATP-grasp enzyme
VIQFEGERGNSPSILIVTHKRALEVDGVIDQLRIAGAKITRLNLCDFPAGKELALSYGCTPANSISQRFDAGWLHDFGSFSTARSLTGLSRDISLKECSAFARGVLATVKCNWLNEPQAIEFASNKCVQLDAASDLGLPIPATLITNSAVQAASFIKEYRKVVVKALGAGYVQYGKRNLKLYTRRSADLPKGFLKGLEDGPVIFQAEIAKQKEVRVTIVKRRCFAVEFDCSAIPAHYVDIRQIDYRANRHNFARAPNVEKILRFSKQLMKRLGLNYAGLDWVIDGNGDAFFLECNPLGSFKWSEICASANITGAISRSLLENARVPKVT